MLRCFPYCSDKAGFEVKLLLQGEHHRRADANCQPTRKSRVLTFERETNNFHSSSLWGSCRLSHRASAILFGGGEMASSHQERRWEGEAGGSLD